MTFVFLAILVMAWAIVFLPAVQRAARETPLRSAEHFRRGMQVIAPGHEQALEARAENRRAAVARVTRAPRPAPAARPPARRLRPRPAPATARSRHVMARKQLHRQALGVLLTLAGWSAITALFLGGGYWELHLAIDAVIGLYAIYLAEERRRAVERATKVRTLRRPPARHQQRGAVPRPNDIRLYEAWAAVEEG